MVSMCYITVLDLMFKGAMMETINMERAYDRLDELKEFLANFPESELVPAVKNEIRYLEKEIEANLP